MFEQPARRLQQVARRCLERAHDLERRVYQYHFGAIEEERRHLKQDAPERGYFAAGYLQALKDVRELIAQGEFPSPLGIDGGPRVPAREQPSIVE